MLLRHTPSRVLGHLRRDRTVAFPILFSLVVHAALVTTLVFWRLEDREPRQRLSETGSRTVLNLAADRPEPPETTLPRPQPTPTPAPEAPPRSADASPEPTSVPSELPTVVAPPKDEFAVPRAEPAETPRPPEVAPVRVEPPPPPPPPPATTVAFAGVESTRANRIVYAVDASGSMASSLPFVKAELARSVAKLDPTQSFAVIVFRERLGGGESVEALAAGTALLSATPRAKGDLARWIAGVEPSGRSSTLAGLRAALNFRPDLVLLLTRNIRRSGKGAEGEAISSMLSALERLNPRAAGGARPVVIKVVQFVEDDPSGLMQAIGEAHGDGPGSYRVVPVD